MLNIKELSMSLIIVHSIYRLTAKSETKLSNMLKKMET